MFGEDPMRPDLPAFNENIGGWDTSSVTKMAYAFRSAYTFNQEIGGWDTSKVTDMSGAFSDATVFNQDIGAWDVSKDIGACTSKVAV
ncbi:hypothetical protein JL722_8656 [Aureococcus anophagefferens]|nr:hypothetical protein JL722_8656 [Aureococcus anophagefferens]